MMAKLKRLIALNYPASRLPDDLRQGIDPTHRVTITVEEEGPEGAEYETTVRDFIGLPHAVGDRVVSGSKDVGDMG